MNIYIQSPQAPCFSVYRIFIREEIGIEKFNISLDADGKLLQEKLDPMCFNPVKPFLELPVLFFEEVAEAIKDYVIKNKIPPKNETFMQGKLEATEKHLEDTRVWFEKILTKIVQ